MKTWMVRIEQDTAWYEEIEAENETQAMMRAVVRCDDGEGSRDVEEYGTFRAMYAREKKLAANK